VLEDEVPGVQAVEVPLGLLFASEFLAGGEDAVLGGDAMMVLEP